MAQVMKGLIVGSPGPKGSSAICLLYGAGAPTVNTDPYIAGSQLGSLYVDYANGALYLKTGLPNTWTQK